MNILFNKLTIALVLLLFAVCATYADEPPQEPFLRIEAGQHTDKILRIDSDKQGRWLVSASTDKTIRIWELPALKLHRVIRPPIGKDIYGSIYSVAISPDGEIIAAGGWLGQYTLMEDGAIYMFSRKDGRLIGKAQVPATVTNLHFSHDGNLLVATLSGNNGIKLFHVNYKKTPNDVGLSLVAEDKEYEGPVNYTHISEDGSLFATTSEDGYVRLYNISSMGSSNYNQLPKPIRPLIKRKPLINATPYAIKISPDKTKLAVGFRNASAVYVLSTYDLSLSYAPRVSGIYSGIFSIVAWSDDGQRLLSGGTYSDIQNRMYFRIWKGAGRDDASDRLSGVSNTIMDMISLPDGTIAFSSADPSIGIIEKDGSIQRFVHSEVSDFRSNVNEFKVSPDGLIVSFSSELSNNNYMEFSLVDMSFSRGKYTDILQSPIINAPGVSVNNWVNSYMPSINGKSIQLLKTASSTSLAISPIDKWTEMMGKQKQALGYDKASWDAAAAPFGTNFLLGTNLYLTCINSKTSDGWGSWNVFKPTYAVNISRDGRLAIAAHGDGTIRWYSMMDHGKEVAALLPLKNNTDWIVWTPEGYFTSSPDGARLIGFHLNQGRDKEGRFIPLNNLYDVFYRPDIVQAKLRGEDISDLITLTAEEALKTPPPEVKFTSIPQISSNSKVKVCYQIKSTGGGIGEVRLFQDGKLIRSDGFYRETAKKEPSEKIQLANINSRAIYKDQRGLMVREKKAAYAAITKSKGDLINECAEIEPISGENEISLAAFNATNTVQGIMETTTFTSSRKAAEPHLYILSVGIDTYRDTSINLKYAAKDAKDFIAKLPEKAHSIYKPQNIHLITLTNQQADKQNIMKTFDGLSTKVKHGDGFIYFNASHGVLLQNQYYIVTAGFNGDLDNASTLISSNEIVEMSKKIKSLSQLFIFDTCHAGGVDNIISGLYDARMSVMAKKMGLHIYASAGSVQTAMDGYKGNGLYTHTLLQGVANGKDVDKEKSGKVTVKSLGMYTKEMTTEISTKLGSPQTPYIINFGRDNPLFSVK